MEVPNKPYKECSADPTNKNPYVLYVTVSFFRKKYNLHPFIIAFTLEFSAYQVREHICPKLTSPGYRSISQRLQSCWNFMMDTVEKRKFIKLMNVLRELL